MRWDLTECTDAHPSRGASKRVGYAWAEFRRLDEDGGEHFQTCRIGLEATGSSDGVKDRWYSTTAQRVGADLHFTRASASPQDPTPIGRRDIAEQLAARGGRMHDGPTAYKEALRRELLPFATPELYEQMLEVICLGSCASRSCRSR
jgi:hypothetical protein